MTVLPFDRFRVSRATLQESTRVIHVDFKKKQVNKIVDRDNLTETETTHDRRTKQVKQLNRKIAA